MANYVWKKLSEQEREEIKKQAKKLVLEFGETIGKLPDIPESVVERDKYVREEASESIPSSFPTTATCEDSDFRDLMFKNAPKVKDDCIVAERGSWVK